MDHDHSALDARPQAWDYYRTGLIASAIAYLGFMAILLASIFVGGTFSFDQLGSILTLLGFTLIPAIAIATLLVAPLGIAFGIALREWMPPNQWHGVISGALVAFVLLYAMFAFDTGFREMPDTGTLVFFAAFMIVGAASGWVAQRFYLRWPVRR